MNAGRNGTGPKSTGGGPIASVRISGGGGGASNAARLGIQGDVEPCGGDSPGDRLEEDATTVAMPLEFLRCFGGGDCDLGAFAATSPWTLRRAMSSLNARNTATY